MGSGEKVAEKRNRGSWVRPENSKSCQLRMYVAPATLQLANAKPMSHAAGSASTPSGEWIRPRAATTTRNAAAYSRPRKSVHAISPTAMSRGPTGVARIASYVFAYFSLKKTFTDSYVAPFIAADASRAGA